MRGRDRTGPATGEELSAKAGPIGNADLKRKTFHSVVWSVARVASTNGVGFVVFSVLARILSPDDFGIFALASLVVEFTRIVASAGLGDAVVRSRELDEAFADTAFWANLCLGCCVGAVTWAAAPLYASLVHQPTVAPILRWLAVLVPISSLGGIHTSRALREFGHKALAVRIVVGGLLGGVAAIVAALEGLGAWSLVIQAAIVDGAGFILAWHNFPWRPRLRFDHRLLLEVFGFSAGMLLTQTMFLMLTRMQDMIIARFISAYGIGVYRVAWRMIDLVAQTTILPLVGVSVVTLARLQDDRERFQAAYLRMLGLGALFTFPALLGLGVLSDEIIALLFGAKWAEAGDIVKILALMAVPITLNYFGGQALAALGRSGTIARVAAVQATLTLAMALLAAPYGLRWIAAAYVLRAYLTMPYQLLQLRRDTGIPCVAMWRAVAAPCFASVAMAGILLAVRPVLVGIVWHGAVYVALATLLGCVVFMLVLWLCGGDYLRANMASLRPLWGATRGPRCSRAVTDAAPTEARGATTTIARLRDAIDGELSRYVEPTGKFALLDFPNHPNVGDSAIWLGELSYFRSLHGRRPTLVSTKDNWDPDALRLAVPDGTIFLSGGGNFGDLWPAEQAYRESVLALFPGRRIVQLPQSIHFVDPEGHRRVARAIAAHGNFVLLVRDRRSLEIATATYGCPVRLVPDMAFCIGARRRTAAATHRLLLLLRTDKESTRGTSPEHISLPPGAIVADWLAEDPELFARQKRRSAARSPFALGLGALNKARQRELLFRDLAGNRLNRGMALLSSASWVITDRLHCHILCVLLGIPHIVLDNSYQKLSGFIDAWTRDCDLVHVARSLDEALDLWASLQANWRPRDA